LARQLEAPLVDCLPWLGRAETAEHRHSGNPLDHREGRERGSTLEMTGSRATFRVLNTTWNASARSTLDRVRLKIHVS
jgi:hypothetical protein